MGAFSVNDESDLIGQVVFNRINHGAVVFIVIGLVDQQ
jgi:hypothetical protein